MGKQIKQKTQFPKGVSGNPKGRPPGSKNKNTLLKRNIETEIIEDAKQDVLAVFRKAIELAKEGDTSMIKLVTDKFIANAKVEDTRNSGKGAIGGINIIVGSTEDPPIINAEIIEEEDEDEG